ncbi:MAG: CHRD domain-containing protein [Acidimicrobiia bacterium]|nr:CHRD domain-containing protein [Acidimicrobiia bacterium]
MNVKRTGLIMAVVAVVVLALALPALAGGRPLSASLTGAAEVPNPGDPDGSGTMELTLNQGQGEICFDLEVADVAPLTAAHIHVGEAGSNGGVVVNFNIAVNGLEGCVDVGKALVKEIRQNPGGYYINVHNGDFPAGALRGQLEK